MRWIPIYFLCFLVFMLTNEPTISSQSLKKVALSPMERKVGIINKYQFSCENSYCLFSLSLNKNGSYYYRESRFNSDVRSEGKWRKSGNILILNSAITDSNLNVRISYVSDTSFMVNRFRIGIVRNRRNQLLEDAIVYINNDSIQCSPLAGICSGKYDSIDSIKVQFENGLISKWIKVAKFEYGMIIPIIQIDFTTSNFVVFDKKKFKINKGSLSFIN